MANAGFNKEGSACPRCGKVFNCNAADIRHCQCYGLPLTGAASRFIGEKYDDCLCPQCLQEINQQQNPFHDQSAPGK